MSQSLMNICLITIHKGGSENLFKTYNSICKFLDYDIFCGYLIYESDSSHLLGSEFHSKVIYLHTQQSEGITSALNASQSFASDSFPLSTHYCFIHSGDLLVPDQAALAVLNGRINLNCSVDIVSWSYRFTNKGSELVFRPSKDGLEKAMTISHIGTFISHRLHRSVGGYSEKYKFAMDYHFFFKSRKKASFLLYDHVFTVVDDSGLSSKHPYNSIREVYLAQISECKFPSLEFFGYTFLFIFHAFKRILYDLLFFLPEVRNGIRSVINRRLRNTQ